MSLSLVIRQKDIICVGREACKKVKLEATHGDLEPKLNSEYINSLEVMI